MSSDTILVPNILLSQPLEDFQIVKINNNLIVVSVRDLLQIDRRAEFGDDYSDRDHVYIYTEGMLLSTAFRLKNGVISAHSLSVAGKGVLDVSGKQGSSELIRKSIESGVSGGDGESGGDLSIYVETADVQSPILHVSACGGSGGAGQSGSVQGGYGGSGGNGGNVVVLMGSSYLDWLSRLRQIDQLSTLDGIQNGIVELLTLIPDAEDLSDIRETLAGALREAAVVETNPFTIPVAMEIIHSAFENVSFTLQGLLRNLNMSLQSSIDVSGGNYGVYGDGLTNGNNGDMGKPGTLQHILFDKPLNLIEKSYSPFMMIHPSQCTRLLEKIKLMYLTIDPVSNPQGVKDVLILLLRLQSRTALFDSAKDDSELVKFYNENEAMIGSVGAVTQLRNVYNQSTNFLIQLKNGKDMFGYDSTYVPLVSFEAYEKTLDELIDNFGMLQTVYNNYFQQLQDHTAEMEHVKQARESLTIIKRNAQDDIDQLKHRVLKSEKVIDGYQYILPPLKKKLLDTLTSLEVDIKEYFDFNIDNLIHSLSTLAFAPESVFMIAATVGEFIHNAETKITNDKGIPVNKKYMVRQISTVEADINSLEEGYNLLNNGTLSPDDPSAGKLIASEKELLSFLDDFYENFPQQLDHLKKVFQDYITPIIARNNEILSYNATVVLMMKKLELIGNADAQSQQLNDVALDRMSPDLPDLVTFMSSTMYLARNQIIEMLDLTTRAYRFWSLSDHHSLSSIYEGKSLPQINYATLLAIKNQLISASLRTEESFGTDSSAFKGLIYELSPEDVEFFIGLKQAMILIPTVTLGTTLKNGDSMNPFARMANVRVKQVRVWIDGVKTADNQVRVHISHLGKEEIVSQSGEVFSFTHEPVNKPFIYKLDSLEVIEEVNFGMKEGKSNYAALGPFTTWNISVNDDDNNQLDLSEVTGIRLEFSGTNYDFDSN
jgi:hypothetical protein